MGKAGSGTQQKNVTSGNKAPQVQSPARCRCVYVHTHSVAEELYAVCPSPWPPALCQLQLSGSPGMESDNCVWLCGEVLQMHETGPWLWRIVKQEPIMPAWSSAFESVMLFFPMYTARKLKMLDCTVFPLDHKDPNSWPIVEGTKPETESGESSAARKKRVSSAAEVN